MEFNSAATSRLVLGACARSITLFRENIACDIGYIPVATSLNCGPFRGYVRTIIMRPLLLGVPHKGIIMLSTDHVYACVCVCAHIYGEL